MSEKKTVHIQSSGYLEPVVKEKDTEGKNVKIINGKKYTLVGEDKIPTRVEPSKTSVSHV